MYAYERVDRAWPHNIVACGMHVIAVQVGGCKCINDAEGHVGHTNKTILEPDGQVHVTHNIPPLSNPLTCIGDSEYFLGYGELYWKVHNTKKQPRWKPRVNGRLSSVTGV